MKTREEILKRLLASDSYVSGEQLSEDLAVSRTSVWKHIKKLKEEGYEIESVTNKGYHIKKENHDLSESLLLLELRKFGISTVRIFQSIDSTNLEAKRFASKSEEQALFLAMEQTQGKGRRGKQWESPMDGGLYFSLLLRPDILPKDASMITLLAGFAVAKAIRQIFSMETGIKWPNDLVVSKKKICGILTEMSSEIDSVNYVVIGIGINLLQLDFPKEIGEIATSLARETAWEKGLLLAQRHTLLVEAIKVLHELIERFQEERNLEFIRETYNALCVNVGQQVRVIGAKNEFIGVGRGIDSSGELLVEKEDGTLEAISSGEVSVRGIYGYV